MSNELNPVKIAQLLTKSAQQLDNATLSALEKARHKALERQSTRVPVLTFTSASGHATARWADRLIPHSAAPWIAAVLLAAILLAGTSYWKNVQEQQIDDTDVAILTSDLPIEVFVN
ncbi:MAG: DUF3619 family protein [Gallionella sp.]|nr:DUF3619 family protein [Gallionella sp.]